MGNREHFDVAILVAADDGGCVEASWPGYQRVRAAFDDGVLAEDIGWPDVASGHWVVVGVTLYQPGTDTVVRTMSVDRTIHLFSQMSPRFEAKAIVLPSEADIAREHARFAAEFAELARVLRNERDIGAL